MQTKRFSPFPKLTSLRLTLRQLVESDAPSIFSLRSNPEVNQYLGRPLQKSIAEAQAFIEKINCGIAQDESMYWAISLQGNPNLIGTICLWNFSENLKIAELGYELLPDFQGQGIMSEALPCVLNYAFETLALDSVLAYTHIENTASRKLLEQQGFVLDTGFGVAADFNQKFSLPNPNTPSTSGQ